MMGCMRYVNSEDTAWYYWDPEIHGWGCLVSASIGQMGGTTR